MASKRKVVKVVSRFVVSVSTSYCVNQALSLLVPVTSNPVATVARFVGSMAISSLVVTKVVDHTDEIIDNVVDTVLYV